MRRLWQAANTSDLGKMTQLRPFQQTANQGVYSAWAAGCQNVLLVIPTGGGKTVMFSEIMANNTGASVAIAHRQELVSQISVSLARNGVRHRIIGPPSVARACTSIHLAELKRNYIDPAGRIAVAGVDTLIRMEPDPWMQTVSLAVCDEAHHITTKNKWGLAMRMFPNARGLGVTATPLRLDGQGLGRHADGIMDHMVVGPNMRELITLGWLVDYKIFAPPSDLDLRNVSLSAGGDFSPPKLAIAVHKSRIVGDIVQHYQRITPGKQGITFAVDVVSAGEIAAAYRLAGVPAESLSAKTPDALRASVLRKFRNREIKQLVNVGLFDEGFDVPDVEVVSDGAPTMSFTKFAQRFGRMMRIFEGKLYGVYIDHVGNVHRHGLPDSFRDWTLDRRERRSGVLVRNVIPVRTCPQCTAAYERIYPACPYCGFKPEPQGRGSPELVDGDLSEMTPEALARLRGEIDAPPAWHPDRIIAATLAKHHRAKVEAQTGLRAAMALWGGQRTAAGDSIAVAQRRFYHRFGGIDVATAQTLNAREAMELTERIKL